MKKIPVEWESHQEADACKVSVHVGASELRNNLFSIVQKNTRGLSLNQLQKLNMEQLRQWEEFPARILRSL